MSNHEPRHQGTDNQSSLTFLNSDAHFRMVVEIGGGSVAWGASTAWEAFLQNDHRGQSYRVHLRSTMASMALQSKESIRRARKGLG